MSIRFFFVLVWSATQTWVPCKSAGHGADILPVHATTAKTAGRLKYRSTSPPTAVQSAQQARLLNHDFDYSRSKNIQRSIFGIRLVSDCAEEANVEPAILDKTYLITWINIVLTKRSSQISTLNLPHMEAQYLLELASRVTRWFAIQSFRDSGIPIWWAGVCNSCFLTYKVVDIWCTM